MDQILPDPFASTYRPSEDPANYKVGQGQRQDPFMIPMAWLNYMKEAATPKKAPPAPETTTPKYQDQSIITTNPALLRALQQASGMPNYQETSLTGPEADSYYSQIWDELRRDKGGGGD